MNFNYKKLKKTGKNKSKHNFPLPGVKIKISFNLLRSKRISYINGHLKNNNNIKLTNAK